MMPSGSEPLPPSRGSAASCRMRAASSPLQHVVVSGCAPPSTREHSAASGTRRPGLVPAAAPEA
eukprot:scaffold1953_cov391-Prasinococcus_capsulatus_cf.AAC.5